MKFNKIISCVLCLSLLLSFSGCKKSDGNLSGSLPEENTVLKTDTKNYITLLYSAADSFNPYTLKTDINRQIVKLLYEPLVKLNNNFEVVNSLASSVVMDKKECRVTLKSVRFSDGTLLTSEDVIYSYNLARNSATSYAKKLYEVESVESEGNTVVVFNVTKCDPYFPAVLDFPIIKKGSDTLTDSDSVGLPPIGCGKYRLNDENNGMVANDYYFEKTKSITDIKLINAPDNEAVAHYTEIGAADIYFTEISDGNITRMSGNRQEINLNNLVYLGINQNHSPLGEERMRQAISSALDRVKLCETAYYNNALPATGFFHPAWRETDSVQNIQIDAKTEITIENLEEIGYNKLNSEGLRVNSKGVPLKFTLLVNSENRIRVLAANTIARQLKSAGIGITVVEKEYAEYLSCLQKGNFQLYLGEIKITDNMDFSQLVLKDGTAAFGLPKVSSEKDEKENTEEDKETAKKTEEETKEDENGQENKKEGTDSEEKDTSSQSVLNEFYNGNATVKDVAAVLQTEMPFVPICYRTGVLLYNENIENVKNSSFSDIYFSIYSYSVTKG